MRDEQAGSNDLGHDHDHDSLYFLFVLHGVFLTLAFAALMPSAIIVARLFLADRPSAAESQPLAARDALQDEASENRPSSDNEDPEQSDDVVREISEKDLAKASMRAKALRVHMYLQLSAVGLCLLGLLLLLAAEGTEGLDLAHGKLGFIVVGAVVLQVVLGFARPEKSSPARRLWLSAHWCLGAGSVAGGCINVFLGISLFGVLFEAKTVVSIQESTVSKVAASKMCVGGERALCLLGSEGPREDLTAHRCGILFEARTVVGLQIRGPEQRDA